MKKITATALIICMVFFAISCGSTSSTVTPTKENTTGIGETTAATGTETQATPTLDTPETTLLSIFAMNGPTGMGIAKLIDDDMQSSDGRHFNVTFADSADEYLSKLIAGDFDIISIPTNLAAVLNTKASGIYKIAAVNTLGVLYMLDTTGNIMSVEDLRGKTVYSTGEGLIPGFVLEYVLTKNGLTPGSDVTVEYLSSPADIGALLSAGTAEIAMLPQPYVTSLTLNNESIGIAFDMTEEFNKVSGDSAGLMTSCIAVKKSTYDAHKDELDAVLNDIKASIEYTVSNPQEASAMIASLGIVAKAAIAEKAIPDCNMVYLTGSAMQTSLLGFYKELYAFKPALCGGAIPTDEIFLN